MQESDSQPFHPVSLSRPVRHGDDKITMRWPSLRSLEAGSWEGLG